MQKEEETASNEEINEELEKAFEDAVIEDAVVEDAVVEDDLDEKTVTQKDYDTLLDKLQRNLAEFDNFRKRTIKEKSEMYDSGVRDTVEKLLPALDNFERAIATIEDKESSTYKGVLMILNQLNTQLEEIGVKAIVCVGEPFDPNTHFAVAHIEDSNFGENTISMEMQKGYTYNDKVIRHSMVQVAN